MAFTDVFIRANSTTVGNGFFEQNAATGEILNNKLRCTGGGNFEDNYIEAPAQADFENGTLVTNFQMIATSVPQIAARISGTGATLSGIDLFWNAGTLTLRKLVNNVNTDLDTATAALNTTDDYRFTLTLDGNTKTGVLRNVTTSTDIATVTENVDSAVTGAGKTGVSIHTAGTVDYDDFTSTPVFLVTLTGTVSTATTENNIVNGGRTAILALTGDTWPAIGAAFDAQRQSIINGITSAQTELLGWNNEVRDNEVVTAIVRTSNTVVTVTFTAAASYNITAQETITVTVPNAALVTSTVDVVATPTFNIEVINMAIGDDFAISAAKAITYTGTTANYTVLAFHRWLQDLADDAIATGNDIMDITQDTPSDRSTDNFITLINSYNINDTAAQHLYDGSIVQTNGDEIYDGVVNYGTQGMHFEVMQNGALITPNFWTTGLNADVAQGISHRFLVKVRTAAADIDGRRLIGMNREFGNTYGEFSINGTARGNNVLALVESNDLNNNTIAATVATWTTITNTEGFRAIDVNNDTVNENYYSEWNRDTFSINQLTERTKWLQRRGTASTLYGLSGDIFRGITHEIDVDTPTGTLVEPESLSWGTGVTAGTGQLLATNSTTAATKIWIQILTGVVPTDGVVITGNGAGTVTMNVTITERVISPSFIGASTGSAIIGAYGVGIESADLGASDKVTDLTDTVINPPNNVTFTVNGLVSTEDRLLVGSEALGILEKDQFSLSITLSGVGETVAVMTAAIPSDTPSAGTIRIVTDGNIDRLLNYVSFTGSTFTFDAPVKDFTADNATSGNNVYLSYIDKVAAGTSENVTWVYAADRALYVRARDGGGTPIKTFESPATMGANGGSITIIRTPDV